MKKIFFAALIAATMLFVGCVDETAQNEEASFAEAVDYTIIGAEPGSGVVKNTKVAIEEYGLDDLGWKLQTSSTPAMTGVILGAVENHEPVIATLWAPHPIFISADLRKLDDPKNIYNDPEATRIFLAEYAPEYADAEVASDVVATITYKGFSDDAPAAYEFFRRFNIPSETQSMWIYNYTMQEKDPEDIAKAFVAENPGLVASWKPENLSLGKEKIVLGNPAWPGVTVKDQVAKLVLEDLGYEVEVKNLDLGIVYLSLGEQNLDATLSGWLPTSHQGYWDTEKERLEIAGININMTWLGLGVPDYVDENIQSLEDLSS